MKTNKIIFSFIFSSLIFLISSCVVNSLNLKYKEGTHPISLKKIIIKGKTLTVEIAETKKQREKGLMGRKFLKENSGMLFIYSKEKKPTFWMKNTNIPLSIGFFNSSKKLIEIKEMQPNSLQLIKPKEKIKYALEVNQGWFKKNQIKVGDYFRFIDHGK